MFVRKGRGVWSCCCPVNVLPCPAVASHLASPWTRAQPNGVGLAPLPMTDIEQKANLGPVVTWHGSERMMSSPVTVLVARCRLKCTLDLCHFRMSSHRRTQRRAGWRTCAGNKHFTATLSGALLGPTNTSVLLSCISLYPGIEGSLHGSEAVWTPCASPPHAPLG